MAVKAAAKAVLGVALIGSCMAAQAAERLPEAVSKVIDCRAVADGAARLACYDTQVDILAQATATAEIVVLDKEAVKKTRRSLFGFSLPPLPFFGGRDANVDRSDPEQHLSAIDATIASAQKLSGDKWMLVLDDGARWQTTEAIAVRDPKAGQPIHIQEAALGSYKAKIDGGRAIRIKRVN